MTKTLLADVEADNLLRKLTRIWCIAIAEPNETPVVYADAPGYPPLKDGLALLSGADKVIFHNGLGYDFWAINRLYPGTLKREQIIDTLILARLLDAERSSHSLADIGEEVGFKKWDHSDFTRFSPEMAKYCAQDVLVLNAVWKKTKRVYEAFPDAVALEHRVAYALAKQEMHGFRFNVRKAEELVVILKSEQLDLEKRLQEVFPPIVEKRFHKRTGKPIKDRVEVFNPGSRVQIAQRLIDRYSWQPKDKTATGQPKVDETILRELPYPEAALCADYLSIGKKLGMLSEGENAWLKLADNGRLYGRVNTIGCRTHRMTHFKPNVAQADTDPRMRGLFEADEGMVLVGCDAEGIELRLLGHYLAPYDGGDFIEVVTKGSKKDGTDAHTRNQRIAGLRLRDSAKTLIYALIYGAGLLKLGMIILQDRINAGEKVAAVSDNTLTAWGRNARNALLKGIAGFKELVDMVKDRHKSRGYLKALDRRLIKSNAEHSALNTLIQSAGAIIMKQALALFDQLIETPKWHNIPIYYCANVHDEVQFTCPEEYAEELGQLFAYCITKAGEMLGSRCPQAGEYKIGLTWAQTH